MQHRIHDQPAFILHRRDYQESSLILELFCQDYGRLSVLAKGARKRRDAGHFQLFNRLSVGWSGRSELKTLTQIESRSLRVPAECYMAVMYINELLLYLLPKQDEHSKLFQHYQTLLIQMERADMEALLRNFEINLLTQLGLMPQLLNESANGWPLNAEQDYCVDALNGVRLALEGESNRFKGSELTAIYNQEFERAEIRRSARRLLGQIIDYNLQGRTLQSRKIYQQLKIN